MLNKAYKVSFKTLAVKLHLQMNNLCAGTPVKGVFLLFLRRFLVVGLLSSPLAVLAHEGDVNPSGCHTPGGEDSGNPCHCHSGSDRETELACANGQPVEDSDAEKETWMGLVVEPEERCSTYDRDLYPYGSSADLAISSELGAIFGPYENRCFDDVRDVSVEHMVALSEAHDSGMCRADGITKLRFAQDPDNLTLASPGVNQRKSHYDVAGWLPDHNRCWYANRVVKVKRKYGMSIDEAERDALQEVLSKCYVTDTYLVVPEDC